eukprot:Skav225635  [mRNA]  locus=scaffold1716:37481:37702:+ [translate_table: standard]
MKLLALLPSLLALARGERDEGGDPSVANGQLTPPDLPFPPMPSDAGVEHGRPWAAMEDGSGDVPSDHWKRMVL